MQTREVIKEIRWIRSLVSTELENWMFHKGMKEEPDVIRCIVDASQFADRLPRNAAAVQIMQAFGLDQLADRETFYPAFSKYRRYSVRREGDSAIRIMKL